MTPLVYLTRVEKFSSAHRLFNESLDESLNCETFGKCQNIHGHNYILEVTVKGYINNETGMLINISQLKSIIDTNVLQLMDHKYLDQDLEHFHKNISTSENICVFIWQQIEKHLPSNVKLHCVKLFETDKNIVQFYGEYSQ